MNPDTGHLVRILNDAAPDGRSLEELSEAGYQEVPAELDDAVQELLGDQDEACLDLYSPSPLSQWAADQRHRKEKKKARNRARRKAKAKQRKKKKKRRKR